MLLAGLEGGEDLQWGFGCVVGYRSSCDPRLSRGGSGRPRPRGGTWGTRYFVEQRVSVAEESGDYAEALFGDLGFADFDAGGEGAELRVDDDLFDGIGVSCGLFGDGGQVEAGDLEAVEEEAGALGVDLVAGDAEQDLADGALDGGAVLGQGDVEVGLAAATVAGVLDRAAGGVVVVAELLVAQAWAAAAVAVGEDVAALVAFRGVLHGGIPRCTDKSQSLQNKGHGSGLRRHAPGLNAKARLVPGSFFTLSPL